MYKGNGFLWAFIFQRLRKHTSLLVSFLSVSFNPQITVDPLEDFKAWESSSDKSNNSVDETCEGYARYNGRYK